MYDKDVDLNQWFENNVMALSRTCSVYVIYKER